jgi:hypothetical protein
MKSAADDPRVMLANPPASLAPSVEQYKQRVVYAAGFTPDRKDYKSDETFQQRMMGIEAAKNSLKEIGLTHDQAQELLVQHFWREAKGKRGSELEGPKLKAAYLQRGRALAEMFGEDFTEWRSAFRERRSEKRASMP